MFKLEIKVSKNYRVYVILNSNIFNFFFSFTVYLPLDLAIIKNDVEIVKILAPKSKNFEPSGILLSDEVQEFSWECFKIVNQSNRKRKRHVYEKSKKYTKRVKVILD